MSKFMIGDRVQINGEPTDWNLGTVEHVGSSFGEDYCIIRWDSQGPRQVDADELFLVYGAAFQCAPSADWEKALLEESPQDKKPDPVNHPSHYTMDPSNVECIAITRHRNFNVGNAIKYLWRNGLKQSGSLDGNAKQIQDLEKAIFYITDEIQRLKDSK